MNIPFTSEQFFMILENYNHTVFPMQIVWIVFAIMALVLLFRKSTKAKLFVGLFLGFIWIWAGIAYHISFFASINKAAYGFGLLFIIQGVLFIFNMFNGKTMVVDNTKPVKKFIALFLIFFALFIYPVIVCVIEKNINTIISLGLPCPTTILTFGFLLLFAEKIKGYLLVIPVLWSLIGTTAALKFGVYPDVMLLISAIWVIVIRYSISKSVSPK